MQFKNKGLILRQNNTKGLIMSAEPGKYCYHYPRPSLTADSVIFGFDGQCLKVLLIERGVEPYKGMWALPGGFMKMDETVEECVVRELREETGMTNVCPVQFRVYSETGRDPRGRVVTVAFIALVRPDDYRLIAGDDATLARWFWCRQLPPLAFDHQRIIDEAIDYLREMLKIKPLAFSLLNEVFSLEELRKVYEAINDTTYDRRNFQRKILQSEIVRPVEDCEDMKMSPVAASKGRPAKKFKINLRLESLISHIKGDDEDNEDNSDSLRNQFNF